jgi:hypothetical protein
MSLQSAGTQRNAAIAWSSPSPSNTLSSNTFFASRRSKFWQLSRKKIAPQTRRSRALAKKIPAADVLKKVSHVAQENRLAKFQEANNWQTN